MKKVKLNMNAQEKYELIQLKLAIPNFGGEPSLIREKCKTAHLATHIASDGTTKKKCYFTN